MSTISVVIPVLNDAELLRRCLRALDAQSRPADEIVVVDNGSTDDSADAARSAGAIVVAEPLRGIAPATAAGFDAVRGDLIARLDADSVPDPDWLRHIEQRFDDDRALDVLTGSAHFVDGGTVTAWVGRNLYLAWYFWAMGALLGHPPLFGSNLALRTSAWRQMRDTAHRTHKSVHDDLDLSFQVRPEMVVRFDDEMRMQISARPFDSALSFAVRSWRGVVTIALNWPGVIPRRTLVLRAKVARKASAPLAPESTPSLP